MHRNDRVPSPVPSGVPEAIKVVTSWTMILEKAPGCSTCFSSWTVICLLCFKSLWLQTWHPLWALMEKTSFLLLRPTLFFFPEENLKIIYKWLTFLSILLCHHNPGLLKVSCHCVSPLPALWFGGWTQNLTHAVHAFSPPKGINP